MDFHEVKGLEGLHQYMIWFRKQPTEAQEALQEQMKDFLDSFKPDYNRNLPRQVEKSVPTLRRPRRPRRGSL